MRPEPVLFHQRDYRARYPDVAAAGMNPLVHFKRYGWLEGRNTIAGKNLIFSQLFIPVGGNPLVAYIQSLKYSVAIYSAVPNSYLVIPLL
jgi:hypothetical protein